MSSEVSPEFALAVACCKWPPSPERDEEVLLEATRMLDWEAFDSLVERHQITSLVHDSLLRAGVALPQAVEKRLAARSAKCAVIALAMTRESVRLQGACDAIALPSLILKGAATGVLAFGDPCLKESSDIDLLTTQERLAEARALLNALGYELCYPAPLTEGEFLRFSRYASEATFLHRDSRIAIDLHWGLDLNRRLLTGFTAESPSQVISVAGGSLKTFSDDLLFPYLCTHGTKHAWCRLKWIAELAAFISSKDEATIERLYHLAVRADAKRAAGASLLLCKRLFGMTIPSSIERDLRKNAPVRRLEAAALHYLGAPIVPGAPGAGPPWRLLFSLFYLAPGAAYVVEQLRTLWVHPTERARLGVWFHVLRAPAWALRQFSSILGPLNARVAK
jgi:hypothetical protein